MNLHQKLKSIEEQREQDKNRPPPKVTDDWENPASGKATRRRQLRLKPRTGLEACAKRGPLEIGMINRNGGHDSLVHRSISIQMNRFERILDSRIKEIKSELSHDES